MDAKRVLEEILEAAKPLTATDTSRNELVRDCAKSDITVDKDLNVTNIVTEKHINDLVDNLSSAILRLVVRKVLRNYL